jgi:hypothetical protein
MNYNKKELEKVKGEIKVKFYGDNNMSTEIIHLNYNSLKDVNKFLEDVKNDFIIVMFLDYINNFTSVYFFAECYGIDNDTALYIINKGREISNGS